MGVLRLKLLAQLLRTLVFLDFVAVAVGVDRILLAACVLIRILELCSSSFIGPDSRCRRYFSELHALAIYNEIVEPATLVTQVQTISVVTITLGVSSSLMRYYGFLSGHLHLVEGRS